MGVDISTFPSLAHPELPDMLYCIGLEHLEELYGKSIVVADRDMVETQSDEILRNADTEDVAFLVVGDPFGATTHADLVVRAVELNIPYTVIHNASIMNAAGACGLALYNFGQTISIPFFTDSWRPSSWLGRIEDNAKLDLHTLCLLDIKVKEQSELNLARGKKIYEPARYMSPAVGLEQILSLLPSDEARSLVPSETLAISISRVGSPTQKLIAGTMEELAALPEEAFGGPLHSLVLVGRRVHPVERDFALQFAVNKETWLAGCKRYGCED